MVEPEKKEAAPQTSAIKNVTRQSLHFHVPGGAIRIQPEEIAEVPSAYLDIAELQSLRRQGQVVVVGSAAAKNSPVAADEEGGKIRAAGRSDEGRCGRGKG